MEEDIKVLNYRGLSHLVERLKTFFIKNPKQKAAGKYLRCIDSNGNVEWASLPSFVNLIDGFDPTTLVIGGTTGRTLTTEAEVKGDCYIATETGTLFPSSAAPMVLEVGDSIIFRRDVAAGTAVTADDIIYIESSVTVTTGTSTLAWNTEITLATVEGVPIKAKLPSHPLPTGNLGDVLFIDQENSNHIAPKQLLTYNAFVETEAELNDLKTRSISLSEIYNNWTAFAHNGDYETSHASSSSQQEQAQEIANPKSFWTYNATAGTMVCSKNSVTYLGFVDNKHYVDNYTMQAVLSSSDSDNDSIGLVIAYYKDSQNKEYTLSVVRTRQSSESHTGVDYNSDGSARTNKSIPMWAIVYNYKQADSRLITSATISGDNSGNWSSTSGTTVKIVRNGDNITCYASPYGSTTLDTTNALTIDLNNIDVLSVFKGKRQYGVSCFSQPASTFSTITIQLANTIYDMRDGSGWVYNNGSWSQVTNKLYTDFEVGRILNSQDFNKSYYIDVPYHNIKINDDSLFYGGTISGQVYQSSTQTGTSAVVTDTKKYNFVNITSGSSVDFKITKPTSLAGPCEVICAIKNSTSGNLTVNLPYPTTGARTDYMWTGSAYDTTNTSVHNMIGESSFTVGVGKVAELVVTYWTGTEASFNGGVEE